ncbi:hypothetical protein [Gynuella sp.]|uniref:hypothetical protein n=1 Tax=Gynuella sp. TaxID=2969146 RepID=UPI003D0FA11C
MTYYIFTTSDLSVEQPDYSEMLKWAQDHDGSQYMLTLSVEEFLEITHNGFLDQASYIADAILCAGEETWVWEMDVKLKLLHTIQNSIQNHLYSEAYKNSTNIMGKIAVIVEQSVIEDLVLYLIFR